MFWSVKNIVLKCSLAFYLHLLQNLSKKLRGHFIKLKPLSKYHMTLSLWKKEKKVHFNKADSRSATEYSAAALKGTYYAFNLLCIMSAI